MKLQNDLHKPISENHKWLLVGNSWSGMTIYFLVMSLASLAFHHWLDFDWGSIVIGMIVGYVFSMFIINIDRWLQ